MVQLSRKQRLLAVLSGGEQPTQSELAGRLGCTPRTVRRHLRSLRKEGVPIQERRDGHAKRYFLKSEDQRRALRAFHLTERQLQALTVAIEAARSVLGPTPLAGALEEAAKLLSAKWLAEAFTFEPEMETERWSFDDPPAPAFEPETFWALLAAMREQRPVRCDYFTASRQELTEGRVLEPYLFAVRRRSWMAVCYCRRSHAVKDFALKGFRQVRLLDGEHFMWKESFDRRAHFAGRFASVSEGEPQVVRLLIEPDRAPYVRRKAYHPSQEIEEERADGRLVVRYEVLGLEEIASFVRSWGPGVTVLKPPALRARIRAEAEATLRRYTEDSPSSQTADTDAGERP